MERITLAGGDAGLTRAARRAADVLRGGGVVAAPTETVYGLLARWDDAVGRARLYALKDRRDDKPLQMLAADLAMALRAGVRPDPRLERLAARLWPGPLTAVVAAAAGRPIGLRVPRHPFMLALLRALNEPVAATSANRSGETPAADAAAAVRALQGEPDLLVDGGPIPAALSSTVADLTGGDPVLLRAGALTLAEVRAAWCDA